MFMFDGIACSQYYWATKLKCIYLHGYSDDLRQGEHVYVNTIFT